MKDKKEKDYDDQISSKAENLEEMQVEELSGAKDVDSLEVSETDEDEGAGDGNIGRSLDDPLNRD